MHRREYLFCCFAAAKLREKGSFKGFLRFTLGLKTHFFHLVIIIIEISWSREEIWENCRIRKTLILATLCENLICSQEQSLIVERRTTLSSKVRCYNWTG
jgi:hypothetical protein